MVVVSAGTVTASETVPEVHAWVWGSPVMAGEDEIAQLVAPLTVADSVTDPPLSGSEDVDGAKPVTVGAGWAATVTVVVALVVLEPVAARENV